MARSFLSTIVTVSREMERANRARIREAERQLRATEREARMRAKFNRDTYIASREAEAQSENNRLGQQLKDLEIILSSRLDQDPSINFNKLFKIPDERELDKDGALKVQEKPILERYMPKAPSIFIRWVPAL